MNEDNTPKAPEPEKSVDLPKANDKPKASQEKDKAKTKPAETVIVLNRTAEIVELDLGRDKSVRLDPYSKEPILKELASHKVVVSALEKGLISIVK